MHYDYYKCDRCDKELYFDGCNLQDRSGWILDLNCRSFGIDCKDTGAAPYVNSMLNDATLCPDCAKEYNEDISASIESIIIEFMNGEVD